MLTRFKCGLAVMVVIVGSIGVQAEPRGVKGALGYYGFALPGAGVGLGAASEEAAGVDDLVQGVMLNLQELYLVRAEGKPWASVMDAALRREKEKKLLSWVKTGREKALACRGDAELLKRACADAEVLESVLAELATIGSTYSAVASRISVLPGSSANWSRDGVELQTLTTLVKTLGRLYAEVRQLDRKIAALRPVTTTDLRAYVGRETEPKKAPELESAIAAAVTLDSGGLQAASAGLGELAERLGRSHVRCWGLSLASRWRQDVMFAPRLAMPLRLSASEEMQELGRQLVVAVTLKVWLGPSDVDMADGEHWRKVADMTKEMMDLVARYGAVIPATGAVERWLILGESIDAEALNMAMKKSRRWTKLKAKWGSEKAQDKIEGRQVRIAQFERVIDAPAEHIGVIPFLAGFLTDVAELRQGIADLEREFP